MTFSSSKELENDVNDGYNYFTEGDFHLAINKLNLKKLPRPDGLTSRLHKVLTDEFCSILAKVLNQFVQGGSFYITLIKLLPKSRKCHNINRI